MGVRAISQALDLIPSAGLHILRALVAEELVKVDPVTKQYSPGSGLISLARTALESDDFPSRVQPRLDDLSRRYGVTAIGVELPNLRHVDVSSRFSALISATGRCLAAFSGHPPAEIEKRFKAPRWSNAPSYEAWLKEVETVRRQGYSIDRGNYIAGVTIVAVPVLNAQATISHTLASVGISSQLDRSTTVALAHDMHAAAGDAAGKNQIQPSSV